MKINNIKIIKTMRVINFRMKAIKIYSLLLSLFGNVMESFCGNGGRTFGGYKMSIREAPYVVLLVVRDGRDIGKCTGSIVAEDWVLTAAHCIITQRLDQIKIIAGIDDLDNTDGMQVRFPNKLVFHPKCRLDQKLKWDLVLMQVPKFDVEADNVDILRVGGDIWPQDESMYKRECRVIGWGLTDLVNLNTKLHAADILAEHGAKACKCLYRYEKKRAVCLVRKSGVGICSGDSGGPLVCDGKNYGVAHLIYDIGSCTMRDVPDRVTCGRYSTVGVYTYLCPELDWIHKYVSSVPRKPESCSSPGSISISPLLFITSISICNYII